MKEPALSHIKGPYKKGNRFRCYTRIDGKKRWFPTGATPEEAVKNTEASVRPFSKKTKAEIKREKESSVVDYLSERTAEFDLAESSKYGRQVTQAMVRDNLFTQRFEAIAQKVFAGKLIVQGTQRIHKPVIEKRILNLMLSDLHFQSLLDPREVPIAYGPNEESRRLAYVINQAAEYKTQYRSETTLYLHILGDLIQGQLHDARDGAPQAEQVCAAIWYMTQAIGYLSARFPKVTVFWVPGNHGRNTGRHPGRAIHQKWDAIETQIGYAVKIATKHLTNVDFKLFYTPYYTYEAFGEKGFMTHGDTVFEVGNAYDSISIARISGKIHQINDELRTSGRACSLFGIGHFHIGHHSELPSGESVFINGALVPADPYAMSLGRLQTRNGQWLWESVPGHLVGDTRFCSVDSNVDKDQDLNKIIMPFRGIE